MSIHPVDLFPRRRNLFLKTIRWSILIFAPLIIYGGVQAAFYHGNMVVMGQRVHNVWTFLLCVFMAPIVAAIVGALFWFCFIAPFQLMFWMIDEVTYVTTRLIDVGRDRRAVRLQKPSS